MPATTSRKRGHSLHLDLPGDEDSPPIAALFLVRFDIRKGYTIAWQRSVEGLELNDSVEYRSLPSGLHDIESDVIYFTHTDEYVGISAYKNTAAEGADRGTVMLAVGILVPGHGQLGRVWLHVEDLKQLAKTFSESAAGTQALEEYWDRYCISDSSNVEESHSPSISKLRQTTPQSSSNGALKTRNRALSSASGLVPRSGQGLSQDHPAKSLRAFIDTFGPLMFPIYKMALLRKRVLLITQAPVESACKFVYDCSLISGIPSAVTDIMPLEPLPIRLRALYNVGLHDMDALADGNHVEDDFGWVACTTDHILAQKSGLFDYIVRLPPTHAKNAQQKFWPQIHDRTGLEIKATQRDLRRYRVLKKEIARFDSLPSPSMHMTELSNTLTSLNNDNYETDTSSTLDADLAEKRSLIAVAYDGFLWWAAAGEKRTDLDEEEQQDAALLHQAHGEGSPNRPYSGGRSPAGKLLTDSGPAGLEITVIAFFHRLTGQIMKILADVVADADETSADEENDDDDEEEGVAREEAATVSEDSTPLITTKVTEKRELVQVDADDMSRMGLDLWSQSDRLFVEGLVSLYWGRKAKVAKNPGIECCGMRIC